jgi:hypothetical protein
LIDSNDGITALRIVEQICKIYCDLIGWHLSGKAVLLRVDESSHSELLNTILKGTIYDIKSRCRATRNYGSQSSDRLFAIVHIDSLLIIHRRNVEWLLTVPRHTGYSLNRLYCTWITVYVHILDRPSQPDDISWDNISAICQMKLER